MSVSGALATLGRLLRRTPPPPADVLEAYAHEVVPVLDRAEWLYQYWLEQSTLFSDSEKLGNVAAIHRWETASMGRSLERVIPPAVLAGAHEAVLDALDMASRAAQLLSSGSRFHNANAVCEGQALLAQSRERRLVALQAMRRYLAAVLDADTDAPPSDPQAALTTEHTDPAAARPTGVAEGAAEVSVDAADVQAATDQASSDQAIAATATAPEAAETAVESPDSYPIHPDDAAFDLDGEQYAMLPVDDYDDDDMDDVDVDDEEDALPWLTRLAEQESSAAPTSVQPAVPPPESQPQPAFTPEPAPPPPGQQQPPGGWGSLFRRPAPPAESQNGESSPPQR